MPAKVPSKETSSFFIVPLVITSYPWEMGYLHPSLGSKFPHEGLNKSSPHEHLSTGKGIAKTNKYSLQGSISHNVMPSKPYLIIKPLEHVHQTPLFKLNKFSKNLYNFSNLGVGGVSRHPIGPFGP
jgi:hypothetical protein